MSDTNTPNKEKKLPLSAIGIENSVEISSNTYGLFFFDIDKHQDTDLTNDEIHEILDVVNTGDVVLLDTQKGYHVVSFMIRDPITTLQKIRTLGEYFGNTEYASYGQVVLRISEKIAINTMEVVTSRPEFNTFLRYPSEGQLTSLNHLRYYVAILGKYVKIYASAKVKMLKGKVTIHNYHTK
jgi:hypothetical protein